MAFKGIIGHERQKAFLASLMETGRVPHAFLFSGMDGVGKRSVAKELVKYLFCETRSACGMCRPCRKVEAGTHPDFFSVTGTTSIGIDQIRGSKEKKIRGIEEEIYEYPYESDRRVILMDGAELMTRQAADAFLKTLEEPPPFNLFILVTSQEGSILLTIRSRCMRIGFGPLKKEELKEYFLSSGMDQAKSELLSSISQGSVKFGLFWSREENYSMRRRIAEVLFGTRRTYGAITALSERIAADHGQTPLYLSFLLSLFRDMWVAARCGDTSMIVNRDMDQFLGDRASDGRWIGLSIQRIQESMRTMRYNVNRWLGFENLLIQIVRSS